MAKVKFDRKKLEKMIKKLNKLDLVDEIDIDEDETDEDLAEAYTDAIREIDEELKKSDKLKENMIEFNNELVKLLGGEDDDNNTDDNNTDEFNRDDVESDLEDMEFKEVKTFVKENKIDIKIKKDEWEDDQDDVIEKILDIMEENLNSSGDNSDNSSNEDDLSEKLEDMEFKELKEWKKENLPDFELKKSKWKDDKSKVIKKMIKEFEKSSSGNEKSDKKNGKDKKSNNKETPFKSNSKQAKMYLRIEEGDCTINDLALILNDDDEKDVDKKWNSTVHTLARKFADKAAVNVKWSGTTVGDGKVTLVE